MLTADMSMHKAVVLNSDTGLVGMPQQTIGGGVNVKCLINPNIRLNGLSGGTEGLSMATTAPAHRSK